MKQTGRPIKIMDWSLVRKMHDRGFSIRSIASAFGVSSGFICQGLNSGRNTEYDIRRRERQIKDMVKKPERIMSWQESQMELLSQSLVHLLQKQQKSNPTWRVKGTLAVSSRALIKSLMRCGA